MSVLSAAVLLFLVLDPLGNIPIFVSVLKDVEPAKHRRIIARECVFAYIVLLAFLFAGRFILTTLQIDKPALGIAGGVILFLVAIRLIFPSKEGLFGPTLAGEPFFVPLAVPLIAGPSAMAVVMLLASREPERAGEWLIALSVAWAVSSLILMLAEPLARIAGERALAGLEKLMGMLLTAVAVQMFLDGLRLFLAQGSAAQ